LLGGNSVDQTGDELLHLLLQVVLLLQQLGHGLQSVPHSVSDVLAVNAAIAGSRLGEAGRGEDEQKAQHGYLENKKVTLSRHLYK